MSELETKPGCLGRVLQLLARGVGREGRFRGRGHFRGRGAVAVSAEGLFAESCGVFFFRVLQAVAAERGEVVCCKVNLGDLLYIAKGTEKPQTWRNKIDRKHADFVLCEAETMKPVAVVELDDASHGSDKAKARDAEKDRALGAAGLPLVRVRARQSYELAALREQLAKAAGEPLAG